MNKPQASERFAKGESVGIRLMTVYGAVLLALLTLVFATLAFAGARSASASHAWNGYHWAGTGERNVPLGDNVEPLYDGDLAQASSDWSASSVIEAPVVAGAGCSFVLGTGQVCNGFYGQTGWVGLASISIDVNQHIRAGKAQMNDTYLQADSGKLKRRYNDPAWRDFVMCQEVGHIFGLDHQDETFYNDNLGTCMDYTNRPEGGHGYGPANLSPNAHDYEQLEIIYAHDDGGSSPGNSQGALHQPDVTNPDERGNLVSQSASSKTFVREYADGSAVITVIELIEDE